MAIDAVKYSSNVDKFSVHQLWTPSDTTTALWVDAADAATITESGGYVSGWGDKSGNGRNVIQGTAANQPQTGSITINGLNAIYLDGSNDGLRTVAGATWLNNTVFTVFAVALEHTWNSQNSMINCTGNADANSNFDIGRGSDFDYWDFRTQTGTAIWQSTPVTFEPLLSATMFFNTHSQHWLFGTDYGQHINPNNAISGITEPLNLGLPDLSGYSYAGSFGEVVIITGGMTLVDLQKMEGYLAWKWGLEGKLPIGHPYKTEAPYV